MKKFMRKISLLVAITVLATMMTASFGVSATETGSLLTPGQEGLLRHLSIITESVDNYDRGVTRGELAHIVARIANVAPYTGGQVYFHDVAEDNQYYDDISALVLMGVLSGDGNGYFRPNDGATELEACKMFSVVLGYGEIGQFETYQRTAREAGVTDGVAMDGRVTYAEALAMAYNTLDADMMEPVTYGETREYKVNQGYLAIERYHGLVKQTGIVEGMQYTTLIEPSVDIGEGQLKINNRIFNYEDETLLGKYTVFYSKRDGSSTSKDIEYIYADETRNNIVSISGEDVIGIQDGELKYWVGAKEKGYKLALAPDTILNGIAYPEATDEDLKPASGTVTLIDNNDDNLYDVISIESVEYVVYGSRDKDNEVIYGKYPEVTIGGKSQTNDIAMTGPYGKVNIGTLTSGAVLRIYSSKNTTGTRKIRMTQLSDSVTGQVTTYNDKKITIAGKDYVVNKGTVVDETVRLGETVTVYPDGEMAAVILHASNDTYQFAYLVGARNAGGAFSGKLSVRLVDKNYILQEYDAADTFYMDEIKYTKVDAILARFDAANAMRSYNEDMELGVTDVNTGMNDLDRMEEGDEKFPYAQPIRFKLNNEGQVTHIDTIIYEQDYELEDSLQPIEPGKSEIRRLAYVSYPYSFYNSAGTEIVFTAQNIDKILRVQQIERDKTDNFRATIIDGHYPIAEAFTVDPITKVAKYVMVYDEVTKTTTVSNRPYIVGDIYDTLDEDGEPIRKVELLHPAGSQTVTQPADLQMDLAIGDVIQVETNGDGVLQAVTMMFDQSLGKDQKRVVTRGSNGGYHNLYFNFRVAYGTMVNFDGTIYTHTTSVKEDGDGVEAFNELHNFRHNGTIIYIYDDNNGDPMVRQGSTKDLITYNVDPETDQKTVVCIQRGGHVQYVMIIKEG